MRTLIAGIVVVILGIAGSEYLRRNPKTDEKPKTEESENKKEKPVDNNQLTESDFTEPSANIVSGAFNELAPNGLHATGLLLRSPAKIRELRAGTDFGMVVAELNKQFAVVKFSKTQFKVIAVRGEPISVMAVDGNTVVWAEGSRIISVGSDSGNIKTVANFPKGMVVALAASNGVVVAALTPKNADPFSSEPNSALVSISQSKITVIARDQIRPHDALLDATEVFWISGYPAWLNRAPLDGSFSAKIADRADGPLGFDGDFIVHRFPQSSGPEVRRMARTGGSVSTLAQADVDWLASVNGVTVYTTSGIGPRLFEVHGKEAPVDKAALTGTPHGLARSSEGTYVVVSDELGVSSVVVY